MTVHVAQIADMLRASRGVAHKADIAAVVARLGLDSAAAIAVGDDCAAIPDGDGFLLFAIEGFVDDFVAADPFFAGYCGAMVNVSDVAAMGGRPIAIVDAVWSQGADAAAPILDGLRAGAAAYGVPIVGGHSNARSDRGQLAVAILGRADKLLTSFDARSGDALLAAIDLRGRFRDPFPYWDASTGAPSARLRGDIAILAGIAEDGLALAAKDISMGGAVGTAMMLLEASRLGASIEIARLPRPEGVDPARWLTAFPSFGYVLAVAPDKVDAVAARFAGRGIACAAFGTADDSRVVRLVDGAADAMVWDFRAGPLIGCGGAA